MAERRLPFAVLDDEGVQHLGELVMLREQTDAQGEVRLAIPPT